jgi:antitoxin component HigA of HigAB toxin-antitoxin module
MEIFHAEAKTSESDEMELLMVLVKDYDNKHFQLPKIDVLEVIRYKMQEMELKNKDLKPIIGSKGHVSAVLSGKREITSNCKNFVISLCKPISFFCNKAKKTISIRKYILKMDNPVAIRFFVTFGENLLFCFN